MSSIIKYSQVLEGDKIFINHNITQENFSVEPVNFEDVEAYAQEYALEMTTDETPNLESDMIGEEGSQTDSEQMISRAVEEIEALKQQAYKEIEEQKLEAQQFCEELIRQQQEAFSKHQEEMINEKKVLEDELSQKKQTFEEERKNALEILEIERVQMIQAAEKEVVTIIQQLLELLIGECIVDINWIQMIVAKLVRTHQLEFPIKVYISEQYLPEEMLKLEAQFKEVLGEVDLQVKLGLEKHKIEVETNFGNMEYDVLEGCSTLLRQLSLLSKVERI